MWEAPLHQGTLGPQVLSHDIVIASPFPMHPKVKDEESA
jgi:hypothetical protein